MDFHAAGVATTQGEVKVLDKLGAAVGIDLGIVAIHRARYRRAAVRQRVACRHSDQDHVAVRDDGRLAHKRLAVRVVIS